MKFEQTPGYKIVSKWLAGKKMKPFDFQKEAWQQIHLKQSGIVNAPTGFGKTFSVFLGAVINYINQNPTDYTSKKKNGLQLLWVTPLRALAKDIMRAMLEVVTELNIPWNIGSRNGDTETNERQKQKRNMPEVLIITPESLHLLLAQKGYPETFKTLQIIAIDEWHELIGSKRGVQVELALSRLIACNDAKVDLKQTSPRSSISIWGISATIGNLQQAKEVLLAPLQQLNGGKGAINTNIIKAEVKKDIEIISVIPEEIEKFPWAGHLGLNLAQQVVDIIRDNTTTLIFINTRGMSERWYQKILDIAPDLAGAIALHHGSIERELRTWVEEALHTATLKAVVCTASLDLGVDFRPVETVIQVGSPKGVARFLQRAGRSGHQPGKVSRIYFLPTHTLELVEAAALKQAMNENLIESREPRILCFDVLIQYLCTLAVGEGFKEEQIFEEIKSTYCFADITLDEYQQIMQSIVGGGVALQQYDEYKKVEAQPDGSYKIKNRRLAMRHRMHIGTIVSDPMLKVKFISGGYIGVIEEFFISRLEPGAIFTLAGRNLELVMIKDLTVLVRKSISQKSIVPSWNGGRMPLSSNLGLMLRRKFNEALTGSDDVEIQALNLCGNCNNNYLMYLMQTNYLLNKLKLKMGIISLSIRLKEGWYTKQWLRCLHIVSVSLFLSLFPLQ